MGEFRVVEEADLPGCGLEENLNKLGHMLAFATTVKGQDTEQD